MRYGITWTYWSCIKQ